MKRQLVDRWGSLGGWPLGGFEGPEMAQSLGLVDPPSSAGVCVSELGALSLSAVWRGCRVRSETVARMPLKLYRRTSAGREEETTSTLYRLLHDAPNPEQHRVEFLALMEMWACLYGNAYAEIVRAGADPVALWPIPPTQVHPQRDQSGQLVYRINGDTVLPADDVLHFRGPSIDGIQGLRLVRVARDSLGACMATEDFVSRSFANNMKLGGWFVTPERLDETAVDNLSKSLAKMYGGTRNAGKWGFLHSGLEPHPHDINLEQVQAVELLQRQVIIIGQWLGVPSSLMMDLTRSTFHNYEQDVRSFYDFCINPLLVRYEAELNKKLVRSTDLYAEFERGAIIQADAKTQAEVWKLGVDGGWLEANDIRRMLNLPPIAEQPQPPVQGVTNVSNP